VPPRASHVAHLSEQDARIVQTIDALLDHLDLKTLETVQGRQDALGAQRLVLDLFLDRD
jgi:hypothetical protein